MGIHAIAFSASLLSFYMKVLVYSAAARLAWIQALCDHLKVFSDAVEVYTRLKDINRAKINDLIRPTPADPGEEDLKHPSQDNGLHQQMIVEGEGEPDDVSASLKDSLRGDVGAEKCPSCFYKRLARVDQDYGRQYDDSALRIPTPIVDQHDEKVVQNGKKKAQHTDEQGEDSQERCSETKREVTKTISKHIEETGIVTLVCRHGVVWKYVDMVRSGEGSKHSKTLVHWLIVNDLAKGTVIGYDTGCTLKQTLSSSKMLSADVKENDISCESVKFLIMRVSWTEWVLKTLKAAKGSFRTPTSSQECAGIPVAICADGCYPMLSGIGTGKNIAIKTATNLLSRERQKESEHGFAMSDDDLKKYQEEEKAFLLSGNAPRQKADEKLENQLSYMKAVTALKALEEKLEKVETRIAEKQPGASLSATEDQRPISTPQLLRAQEDGRVKILREQRVLDGMAHLAGIDTTKDWQPGSDNWQAILKEQKQLDYRKALRAVESECIKRMLEMDKLGFAGTGREAFANGFGRSMNAIMTAVNKRSKKLHDLVKECNAIGKIAGKREELKWDDVVGVLMEDRLMATLCGMNDSEFESVAWAHPGVRQAVRARLQTERAQEELVRLSVEWRRLRTWVGDREAVLQQLITRKQEEADEREENVICGVVSALERRLEDLVLDHRRILVALEDCKDLLTGCPRSLMTLEVAVPLANATHLPEMDCVDENSLPSTPNSTPFTPPSPPKTFPDLSLPRLRSFNRRGSTSSKNHRQVFVQGGTSLLQDDMEAEAATEQEDDTEQQPVDGEEDPSNDVLENYLEDDV
ncbi:hypothetical protein QFC21_001551 [Naganishia friedmannii]|uniref:Uncharacterized protein n=1 Tax=Naganishia friedmannii TaxID=89922 RepID=A0ACC2W3U4_9TREE|nr:hypothetical protein QFC21_001551 [Naganishia friedmannii]